MNINLPQISSVDQSCEEERRKLALPNGKLSELEACYFDNRCLFFNGCNEHSIQEGT